MTYVPFAAQTKDEQYSGERLVNWFARGTEGGVGPMALISRCGLSVLQQPSSKPGRGMVQMRGDIYFVVDKTVWKYEIVADTLTNMGSVPDDPNTSIAASGQEVAIVAGSKYHICDGTTTTEYTTGALTRPRRVVHLDGYFLVSGTISGRDDGLTNSALDDGTTFDATEFAFAENAPDEIRGMIADHGRIYVLGQATTEVFFNAGGTGFPFVTAQSEMMERGCLNGSTVGKLDNAIYWVGSNNIVYRSFGATPEVISSPEVKEMLDGSTVDGALTFTDRGQEFYGIRRTDDTTLCFDVGTGLWHERSTGAAHGAWVVNHSLDVDGTTYLLTSGGKLCTADKTTIADDGSIVLGEAISRPLVHGGAKFNIAQLRLRAQTSGPVTGYTDPQIMMQTSRNGVEWNTERWRSLGGVGEYNKQVEWHGLGQFREAYVRLRVSDPVQRDLYGISYV